MLIPTYDRFMYPLLQTLAKHPGGLKTGEACEATADHVGLSQEARDELLPSGRQAVYRNRIGWAHDRLKRAGLSSAPKRGFWQITEEGRAFLQQHPDGIDDATRKDISVIEWPPQEGGEEMAGGEGDTPESPTAGPEERIEVAVAELHKALADDLLGALCEGTPEFFERVVLDVLHAMGYGTSRADIQRVGRSGDGGIDGVISLDRLGLQKVYVQAKRWQGSVGRPEIQSFFGALAGRRAAHGVMLTTGSFSSHAEDYAGQVSDSIVLVDGRRLASLMIEHGVGVSHRALKVGRMDTDYFDEEA